MKENEEVLEQVAKNYEHSGGSLAFAFAFYGSFFFHFVCFIMVVFLSMKKFALVFHSRDVLGYGVACIQIPIMILSSVLALKIKHRFYTRKMVEHNLMPAFKPRIKSDFESGLIGTAMHREANHDFTKFAYTCWGVVYVVGVPTELIFRVSKALPMLSYLSFMFFSCFMMFTFGISFHSNRLLDEWNKKRMTKLNV